MNTFEVEVKSLLGGDDQAKRFRSHLSSHGRHVTRIGDSDQRNHYFVNSGDSEALVDRFLPIMKIAEIDRLRDILNQGRDISLRTREHQGDVLLVVKASVDETSSENGIARMEFEEVVPTHTLEELDQHILESGYSYQAKWSRHREEYRYKDIVITLDRNAGYGWIAEFEKSVDTIDEIHAAKKEIYELMEALGIEELPQDRLERMFTFYNNNWQDYYGTEKVFSVE